MIRLTQSWVSPGNPPDDEKQPIAINPTQVVSIMPIGSEREGETRIDLVGIGPVIVEDSFDTVFRAFGLWLRSPER